MDDRGCPASPAHAENSPRVPPPGLQQHPAATTDYTATAPVILSHEPGNGLAVFFTGLTIF